MPRSTCDDVWSLALGSMVNGRMAQTLRHCRRQESKLGSSASQNSHDHQVHIIMERPPYPPPPGAESLSIWAGHSSDVDGLPNGSTIETRTVQTVVMPTQAPIHTLSRDCRGPCDFPNCGGCRFGGHCSKRGRLRTRFYAKLPSRYLTQ